MVTIFTTGRGGWRWCRNDKSETSPQLFYISLENNMENPAHVYTTGIPMSEKGNFGQNKYGCVSGETLDLEHINKLDDHNYPCDSQLVLRDLSCENSEFINNSIQDGFQSEILCSFICDAGLPSNDDPLVDGTSLEMDAITESDSHIKFINSPGTSFSDKLCAFSSMEVPVPNLDEQLENYLLPEFKVIEHKPHASESLEEQQRTVTETISAIAKSFGLEDLLPDTFQVDGNKDVLSESMETNSLCDGSAENITGISLHDFEKCGDIRSPDSTLCLQEHFDTEAEKYVLDSLEILSDPCEANHSSFDDQHFEVEIDASAQGIDSTVDMNQDNPEFCQEIGNVINAEFVNDIPIVSISEDQDQNAKENSQACSSSGTVVITRDKTSRKMQIVLTLGQGQKVYDIDTEDIGCNEQPLDLEFQEPISDENLTEELTESPNIVNFSEDKHVSVPEETESEHNDDPEELESNIQHANLAEFISNLPVTNKARRGKTWVCPIEDCGQILDKECKLRVHMINHNGARPYKCEVEGCDWAFTTLYRLRRHVETHFGSKDYECDFEGCNRKFTTVYNLKTHKKRHKWPNSLTCPSKNCKMSFANRRKLELHLRVHEDVEAPYKCSLCGKQYYSANCIASHYRTHQYNEDDFKCPFQGCGKVYDKICRLRQHIRHHTGDRPYSCPAEGCKWSFMSASKLTRHMRKHTGERKFVCTEPGCGKSFMRPEHLKGHIVIHSGDKPFECPHENCNARFTAKSSLYVHVKKHCPSVLKVVYPCPAPSCIKKYNSKATLKQHLQKFHPEVMANGKELNIAEKLELTMPVSVVNQDSGKSLQFLEIEEGITDDPDSNLKLELLKASEQSVKNDAPLSVNTNSCPVIINTIQCLDLSYKAVPKSSKANVKEQSSAKNAKPTNLNFPSEIIKNGSRG
ncbi:gastrula zinc finger protein XlCGF48.2-like [Uloborus diversus]|uniref:gastrula zinc finger protein XlCGF48.2-like n=1 Tax=Uloborus diversus TaxID=327109 RepID=UPI00240A7E7A|nr:gastrula zinc finger protein XlCGF48.2-like [Uloborus diversus]